MLGLWLALISFKAGTTDVKYKVGKRVKFWGNLCWQLHQRNYSVIYPAEVLGLQSSKAEQTLLGEERTLSTTNLPRRQMFCDQQKTAENGFFVPQLSSRKFHDLRHHQKI
ncbi:hypothetical protein AVEN_6111-1 [Araneus ventricosus]|uniref:Uncharacterized protein n=1 Tax=Araneus ventricosus TaxID=182803 RepID=A0A4Y2KMR4_ARAVE|nr:hypothetical protein AVEN_6111-1 [Araneus ventricosus]